MLISGFYNPKLEILPLSSSTQGLRHNQLDTASLTAILAYYKQRQHVS